MATRTPNPSLDAVLAALAAAPVDDEVETAEERAAVEVARAEVTSGDVVPHAQLKERLHTAD
jgi:hypothetical protein